MTITESIKFFGNQKKMADALRVTKGYVSIMNKQDRIPKERQWQIQLVSKGMLKADSLY